MKDYIRKVNYYETDKMGVTHHSNYIKWMEEARIYFLDRIGYGYSALERAGISSPVISLECQYKHSTTFDDEVSIHVGVVEFRGVRLTIEYTMVNIKTGDVVLTGKTTHCFVDKEGKPIILKKRFPEFDRVLKEQINEMPVIEV